VLSVEDWAEIRRLRRSERLSISEIARVLGILRNMVKAALASAGPQHQRAPAGSVADEVGSAGERASLMTSTARLSRHRYTRSWRPPPR
jgi:transcriptional regulator with XRE-family HTH domain